MVFSMKKCLVLNLETKVKMLINVAPHTIRLSIVLCCDTIHKIVVHGVTIRYSDNSLNTFPHNSSSDTQNDHLRQVSIQIISILILLTFSGSYFKIQKLKAKGSFAAISKTCYHIE